MTATNLITLRQYDNTLGAQLDAELLKTENIDAVVVNGELISMLWHLSIALGGVQLKVKATDAEQALQVLQTRPQAARPRVIDLHSTNARVHRALKSAVVGILIPPACFYSLWLIGDLLGEAEHLTSRHKILLTLATMIDLTVIVILFMLFVY